VADLTSLDVDADHRPQPGSISRAIHANLSDYWLRFGSGARGRQYDKNGVRWAYSGSPYLNRVVESQLNSDTADAAISHVRSAFDRRNAAVTWFVERDDQPADLGERLQRHGFGRYEDWIGMAHTLCGLGRPPSVPKTTTIVDVQNPEQRRDWLRVVTRSFEFPRSARECLYRSLDSIADNGDTGANSRALLAHQNGEPVAACSLFVRDEVAGIYLVSTLPEHRGQGYGSFITWWALRAARDLGCRLAVLQSTSQAAGMYESLGFCRHSTIQVYRYAPVSPVWMRAARVMYRQVRRFGRIRSLLRRFRPGSSVDDRPAPSHAH
jgi:GNAT superfamily N-acetyltransferase